MTKTNFLFITSLLLFFGLFLIIMPASADNAYYNKSYIHISSGSDTRPTEYNSDQLASMSYPYTFGPSQVYNLYQKPWFIPGGQPLRVDTFNPVNSAVNTYDPLNIPNYNQTGPYYGPGYYMFKAEYPTWTTDVAPMVWDPCLWTTTFYCDCGPCDAYGCYYGYCSNQWTGYMSCWQTKYDVCYGGLDTWGGDWYIPDNPARVHNQGSNATAYFSVLLTSPGTVDLMSLWSGQQSWWYDPYDSWLYNWADYQFSYTPILHDGECGTLNNNGNAYPAGTTSANGTYCNTYPYNPLYDHNVYPAPYGLYFPDNNRPTTSWLCEGSLGGGDRVCAMKLKVNGACNTALSGQRVYSISAADTGMDICTTGLATPVTGDGSTERPWKWGCLGINGGTSTSTTACSATIKMDGTCGTFTNGQYFSDVTTSNNNLCDFGTYANFVDNGTSWSWTCNSSDGGYASSTCTAYKIIDGVCGSAAKIYSKTAGTFSGALCASGNASPLSPSTDLSFPTVNKSVKTWTCSGIGTGALPSPTCTAILTVDGQCNAGVTGNYSQTDSWPRSTNYCTKGVIGVSGRTYYYRVSAINSLGTGSAGTDSATTP